MRVHHHLPRAAALLGGDGEAEGDKIEEEDEDEITYAGEIGQTIVGDANDVLDAGFVIDEDSPEDIMNVFDQEVDADEE